MGKGLLKAMPISQAKYIHVSYVHRIRKSSKTSLDNLLKTKAVTGSCTHVRAVDCANLHKFVSYSGFHTGFIYPLGGGGGNPGLTKLKARV